MSKDLLALISVALHSLSTGLRGRENRRHMHEMSYSGCKLAHRLYLRGEFFSAGASCTNCCSRPREAVVAIVVSEALMTSQEGSINIFG